MKILNIIDKIYESSYFSKFLVIAIVGLLILFFIVLLLGIKDKNKTKKVKIEKQEEVNDITFEQANEPDNIKEDVTFEIPSLTQNLENFKKNLEKEIQKEEVVEVRKTSGLILPKDKKTIKILDYKELEDTSMLSLKDELLDEEDQIDTIGSREQKYINNHSQNNELFDSFEKIKVSNDLNNKEGAKLFDKENNISKPLEKRTTNSINNNQNINDIKKENINKYMDNKDDNSPKETFKKFQNKEDLPRKKAQNNDSLGIYSNDDDF